MHACCQFATLKRCKYSHLRLPPSGAGPRFRLARRPSEDELQPEALLVGLLAEPECRAAEMLARLAVDLPGVRRQWPKLAADTALPGGNGRQSPLSLDVQYSLRLASERLRFLPKPVELATEHVLLGLAAADHGVSAWLREQGLDPHALESEIRSLYGYPPQDDSGQRIEERKDCVTDMSERR